MAHIEVPFGENNHITIVHIPVLSEMHGMLLGSNMAKLMPQVEWPKSYATITGHEMFGRHKNVPAATLESEFLMKCREVCEKILQMMQIKYSADWEFRPHMTNPPEELKSVNSIILPQELRIAFKNNDGLKSKVRVALYDLEIKKT